MRNLRDPLLMMLAAAIGALAMALAVGLPSAEAASATTDNPWTFQMTNPGQPGMVIYGPSSGTATIFDVKDYLGQPIFSCPPAGGCASMGDNFRTVTVINNQLVDTNVLLRDGGIRIGVNGPTLYGVQGNPTGACTQGDWAVTKLTGRLYACVSGVWVRKA